MNPKLERLLALALLVVSAAALPPRVSAAEPLADFGFDEGTGTSVSDAINSLTGLPATPDNPPTFETSSPSGRAGDTAVHFEAGQYFTVNDPDTRIRFNPDNPAFTLQAWVKFLGQPAGRQVFFYNNGPGGAVSFSVNVDRTVFVTTLGIADVSSQAAIPDDDAWHHIAVVHDPGVELRFYVDGVLGDSVPYTSGVNFSRTQTLFSIGAEWNGALQYLGSVDRLKISSGIVAPEDLDFVAAPPFPLVDFSFDEGTGTTVTDAINSLTGTPATPDNPPTFETGAPSGQAGDTAVHFEAGQYFTVNDPDTRIRFNPDNPAFTLQAWVKFLGQPAGRQVFFYNNGPGGAVSFSVNVDRTVFVTTLGIADVSSQAAIPDDDAWHHIAVVHVPGVELRFYVDGVLGDTVPYTSGVNFSRTQTLFSIGAEWNGALQYMGSVDRLKIFSGILNEGQLDSAPVPAPGSGGLIIARPSVSPFGFAIGVTDAGGSVVNPDSIALSFNGAPVTPTSVTKSGGTTTISYTAPNAPLPTGSTQTTGLTIRDTAGATYTSSSSFAVPAYATVPASAVLPASSVDKTKAGFRIKTYQIDGGAQEGTLEYNEAILAGEHGPNVAYLDDAGGVDADGYFTWTSYINFDTTGGANGYFNDPDFVVSPFPGIPGLPETGGPVENFVEEILAVLEFATPGMYTMAVNTDWTGFPNGSDGYSVRVGSGPTGVPMGYFNALAPVGPERGVANSPFQFYVSRAGLYPFRLLYYQTTGSANLEWFMVNPDGTRSLINDTGGLPAYYAWTPAPDAPTLSVARAANGLTITFTGGLEGANSVSGPWSAVAGTSPLTVPATDAMKFYRAVR
ncbi:MAG: LamG domain-containing protein [Limisphaerales bacterium]